MTGRHARPVARLLRALRLVAQLTAVVGLLLSAAVGVSPGSAQAALPGRNGRLAYFCGVGVGQGDIYVARANGSHPRRVAENASAAEYTADGGRLLYVQGMFLSARVVVADADGGAARPITASGPYLGPSWSPDARRIAFGRLDSNPATAVPRITAQARSSVWTMRADGIGSRRLTRVPGLLNGLSWSSEGSIVVSATTPSGTSVYLLRDGVRHTIHTTPSPSQGLDTSPSGREVVVALTGPAGGLVIVPIAGGATRRVPNTSGNDLSVVWSPDGNSLLFARLTARGPQLIPRLHRIWLDGHRLRALGGPPCGQVALDWAPVTTCPTPRPENRSGYLPWTSSDRQS